jgi:hypothetical protein
MASHELLSAILLIQQAPARTPSSAFLVIGK